jgi:MscS family membrane protein
MISFRTVLAPVLLLALLLPSTALAADGPCHSARTASRQFLDNLQPDQMRPVEAIRCFSRPKGESDAQMIRLARDLKAVLDAQGLFVIMDDLPDANDFVDDRGRHRVLMVDGYESVELRREKDEWRIPASVVGRIPALYRDTFSGWTEATLQRLPPIFSETVLGYQLWQLVGFGLLLLLSALLTWVVRYLVRTRLVTLLRIWKVESHMDDLAALSRPLGLLAGAGLFAASYPQLRLPIGTARIFGVSVRLVAAVASVVVLYRIVDLFTSQLAVRAANTEGRMDDQLVVLVRKTLRVVVVAVGLVFVLQNLNVDVTSLLAGLGIGGLALALAAKDTAANLFGSITIMIDAPFYVGDWIQAAGVEGTVVEIGLRSTRVRTFYDSVISVPNSVLANANIDNMSKRTFRRLKTRFGIAYHSTPDQIEAFVEGIRAIIASHPDTRKDSYEVHFVEYGASALEVMLFCFLRVEGWSQELQAKHQIFQQIKRLAEQVGVEFAFPTQTLHVDSIAQPKPRPSAEVPDQAALASIVRSFGPEGERGQQVRGDRLTEGFFAGAVARRGNQDDDEG